MIERCTHYFLRFRRATIGNVARWVTKHSMEDKEYNTAEDNCVLKFVFPTLLLYQQVLDQWPGCGQDLLEKSVSLVCSACAEVIDLMKSQKASSLYIYEMDQVLGLNIEHLATYRVYTYSVAQYNSR